MPRNILKGVADLAVEVATASRDVMTWEVWEGNGVAGEQQLAKVAKREKPSKNELYQWKRLEEIDKEIAKEERKVTEKKQRAVNRARRSKGAGADQPSIFAKFKPSVKSRKEFCQGHEEEDIQRDPEEANLSRGNSTRQLVNLGQSNGSSGDILVNTPEYLQRQDEHPCMNTVWEMDTGGGGGIGGGDGEAGRSETDISSQDNQYETDEEEFCQAETTHCKDPVQVWEPPKMSGKTVKRDMSANINFKQL